MPCCFEPLSLHQWELLTEWCSWQLVQRDLGHFSRRFRTVQNVRDPPRGLHLLPLRSRVGEHLRRRGGALRDVGLHVSQFEGTLGDIGEAPSEADTACINQVAR